MQAPALSQRRSRVRLLDFLAGYTLILIALTLGGCATRHPDERLSIAPELAGTLVIEQVVTRRTEGGLLQVDVRARNLLDQPLLLDYQFEWLDEDGIATETLLSTKTRATADRRRSLSIRGIAPSPDITTFRLYLDEREI